MAVTDRRLFALGCLGVLAALSVALTFPGPEVLVTAMGSAAAVLLVRGALRWPIYLYFGFGTLFFLLGARDSFAQWFEYEGAYQTARLGAFAVFAALVFRNKGRASWVRS